MSTKKMSTEDRKAQALRVGVKMARKSGIETLTMADVARALDISSPRMFHIFGTAAEFTKAVKRELRSGANGRALVAEVKAIKKQLAPVSRTPVRKRSVAEVKAIKRAVETKPAAPVKPLTDAQRQVKAAEFTKAVKKAAKAGGVVAPISKVAALLKRKPLTDAQRQAKAVKDKSRRTLTSAEKFRGLPAPFEASVAAVS